MGGIPLSIWRQPTDWIPTFQGRLEIFRKQLQVPVITMLTRSTRSLAPSPHNGSKGTVSEHIHKFFDQQKSFPVKFLMLNLNYTWPLSASRQFRTRPTKPIDHDCVLKDRSIRMEIKFLELFLVLTLDFHGCLFNEVRCSINLYSFIREQTDFYQNW